MEVWGSVKYSPGGCRSGSIDVLQVLVSGRGRVSRSAGVLVAGSRRLQLHGAYRRPLAQFGGGCGILQARQTRHDWARGTACREKRLPSRGIGAGIHTWAAARALGLVGNGNGEVGVRGWM